MKSPTHDIFTDVLVPTGRADNCEGQRLQEGFERACARAHNILRNRDILGIADDSRVEHRQFDWFKRFEALRKEVQKFT